MLYNVPPNFIAFSTERRTDEADRPYAGFNVTPYTGDFPSRVRTSQKRLASHLHIPFENLVIPRQVHGIKCVAVDERLLSSEQRAEELDGVDALITNLPEVCVGVSTADCVPLLFYDSSTGAIGAAHAGWRGTVARIGVLTIAKMFEAYGSRSSDLHCLIGPSIGPEAFEVGEDVYDAFHLAGFPMGQIATRLTQPGVRSPRRWRINLWEANAWQLQRAGVPPHQIFISGICCYTEYAHYFSARRLGINSGRTFSGILRRA